MSKKPATPKKQWPCKMQKGMLKACWAMSSVVEMSGGQGTRYQGLKLVELLNMKTLTFSRQAVVLKSGAHSRKGVFVNYCPFCKGKLNPEAV